MIGKDNFQNAERKAHREPASWAIQRSDLFGSVILLFWCPEHIHGTVDDSENVNLV
jgi:hypothetical protein